MRMFLGQGSNPRHSSDNTGSLSHCATRELLLYLFFNWISSTVKPKSYCLKIWISYFFFFFFFGKSKAQTCTAASNRKAELRGDRGSCSWWTKAYDQIPLPRWKPVWTMPFPHIHVLTWLPSSWAASLCLASSMGIGNLSFRMPVQMPQAPLQSILISLEELTRPCSRLLNILLCSFY